jgi:hypothetical protein
MVVLAAAASCGRLKEPEQGETTYAAAAPPDGSTFDAGALDGGSDTGADTPAHGAVLTRHNDPGRTGANLAETALTPATVPGLRQLARLALDGEVYAQPLYAPQVQIGAATRNLLVVATMNDSVYAFDADAPDAPVWKTGSNQELGVAGPTPRNIGGPNGILSTPVIDLAAEAVYVLARGCTGADLQSCTQTLFALDLASGAVKARTEIAGAVPSASGSTIAFDPNHHWSRAGLLLAKGFVYVAFGAGPLGNEHEEDFVYHGWVFKVSTADGTIADVFCTTPDGQGGGIWQGGGGLAAGGSNLLFASGNGIQIPVPDSPSGWPERPLNAENSLVALPLDGTWANAAQTFFDDRPYAIDGDVFQYIEKNDVDFGASGPAEIPGAGAIVAGAKSGTLYLLDEATLALLQPPLVGFTNLPRPAGQTLYVYSYDAPAILDSPVVWRADAAGGQYGYVYAWARQDYLKSFRYDYASRTLAPFATSESGGVMSAGAMLSLTAEGGKAGSAILWALSARQDGGAGGQISAFDAGTLALLWKGTVPARSRFVPPTIVDGKVFVPSTSSAAGTKQEMFVFGL